ncbi:MAG: MaoC family dehydratase [Dehalococcoidia bacterium]
MAEQRYFDDIDPGDEFDEQLVMETPKVLKYLGIPGSRLAGPNRFNDPEIAKRDGMPGMIVPGVMQLDLMSRVLNDFAGQEGRIGHMEVSFRRSVLHGDKLRALGLVTDTIPGDGEGTIRMDVFFENERGERPLQGTADVILPSRKD